MGYPTEIPNRIPPRGDPPVRGAWARRLERMLAWFARRPRRRSDAPERFGRGVDPRLPPLSAADRDRFDFDQVSRGRS